MTPLDAAVGILLIALCAHAAVLLVAVAHALLPQRRHRVLWISTGAGVCALLGELMVLRGLLGVPASPPIVAGLLGIAGILGFSARSVWNERGFGRAAFHAVVAAPLVVVFVIVLSLR